MKYILMCGGNYNDQFETPKPLLKVNGEILIERTIRLLRENGITDIAISTNINDFDYLGLEILRHKNDYIHIHLAQKRKSSNCWLTAYYPTNEPCCYLAGDVYFSDDAIKKIRDTEVKDTMFICTRDVQDGRPAGVSFKGREPLGYKVVNQKKFRKAINELMQMLDEGKFKIDPISWHLYRQLNGLDLGFNADNYGFANNIFNTKGDYITIDDYTTDIDTKKNIVDLERFLRILKGGETMVKVEVTERFHLSKYGELQNIIRKSVDQPHELFVGDIFDCTEDMAKYLLGANALKRAFVKVIEIIPAKEEEPKHGKAVKIELKEEEEKKAPRKTSKKTTSSRKTIAKKKKI